MSKTEEFTVDGRQLLRSEILGMRYVYQMLGKLTQVYLNIGNLTKDVQGTFEELDEFDIDQVSEIITKRTDLLKKIAAIDESLGEDKLYVTKHGKIWFDLLTELNLPVQRIEPLEIISKDIPGRFFMLLKERAEDARRLVIVSPWIFESKLIRRISKLLERFSITTYVFTRSPEKRGHRDALNCLKNSGATVYINDDIHSKLYLCETKIEKADDSFGIIGSANLTRNARHYNVEVGIIIYGFTDRYFSLIENLIQSCYSLKSREW